MSTATQNFKSVGLQDLDDEEDENERFMAESEELEAEAGTCRSSFREWLSEYQTVVVVFAAIVLVVPILLFVFVGRGGEDAGTPIDVMTPAPFPSPVFNDSLISSQNPTHGPQSIDLLPLKLDIEVDEEALAIITEITDALCKSVSQYQTKMLSAYYDNLEAVLCEAEQEDATRRLQSQGNIPNTKATTTVSFQFHTTAIFAGAAPVSRDVYTKQHSETTAAELQEVVTANPTLRAAGSTLSQLELASFPSASPSQVPSSEPSFLPSSPELPTLTPSEPQTMAPLAQVPYSCNICGCEGCTYQRPEAVVEFQYDGKLVKDDCAGWDSLAQSNVAMAPSFCQNELPRFVREACLCVDGNGIELGTDGSNDNPYPTLSPGSTSPGQSEVPEDVVGDFPIDVSNKTYETLRDIIIDRLELTNFRDGLDAVDVLEGFLGDATAGPYTVFAPSDVAMQESPFFIMYIANQDMWKPHLIQLVNNHLIENEELTASDVFAHKSVQTLQDTLNINDKIHGAALLVADLRAENGILHIVDEVLMPEFAQFSHSDVTRQPEFGPDKMDRVSLIDVVRLTQAGDVLNTVVGTGLTFVGCHIRAFNRMGQDYLYETINGSEEGVKYGELMNASYVNETLKQFIEYSLIPENIYPDDMPNSFLKKIKPINPCADLFVTYRNGVLCFNDGCVEDDRQYIANNGVGYVVDRCILCPGIGMLLDYLSWKTAYNTRAVAQYVESCLWNRRNLTAEIGDGSEITMFASVDSGFGIFNFEDETRLSTLKWLPHLRDLIKYFMVQGAYMVDDLLQLCAENGGEVDMVTLNGENIMLSVDSEGNLVVSGGGVSGTVIFPDIKGVDGYVHLTNGVPLPVSVTSSVYDIAKRISNYSTHIAYIDVVFLTQYMKAESPITALFAPNSGFEGKRVKIEDIVRTVLENHIFEDLLWCDELRHRNNTDVESYNGRLWHITINENNMPCFDTVEAGGGEIIKACISKCDILARNGVMHELDTIMVYESLESIPLVDPENATVGFGRPSAPSPGESAFVPPPFLAQENNTDMNNSTGLPSRD